LTNHPWPSLWIGRSHTAPAAARTAAHLPRAMADAAKRFPDRNPSVKTHGISENPER
jgi:hypothetical protein